MMVRWKILALGTVVLLGRCLSFKVTPPVAPLSVIEEISLCSEVDESGELLVPGERKSEFPAETDRVICFVRLAEVTRALRLKWRWYAPDQHLFKESQEVLINPDEIYLEVVTAYDRITPGAVDEPMGSWHVAVFVNDVLLARLSFRIVPRSPCDPADPPKTVEVPPPAMPRSI